MENGEWKMNEQKLLRNDGMRDSDTEIASGGRFIEGTSQRRDEG